MNEARRFEICSQQNLLVDVQAEAVNELGGFIFPVEV